MEAKIYLQNRPSKWTSRQISLLLTIIALALCSYSITQAKLNIGFCGFISSYPIFFLNALGRLTMVPEILCLFNIVTMTLHMPGHYRFAAYGYLPPGKALSCYLYKALKHMAVSPAAVSPHYAS